MPDAWVVPAVILSVHDGDTINVAVEMLSSGHAVPYEGGPR